MTDKQVTAHTTIAAPPGVVFAIIADPHQHSRIDGSGSVGAVVEGPDRITGTGQIFTMSMRMLGVSYTMRNEVVEFAADRLIAWRTKAPVRWRYEMQPTEDGGTQVTETFDYTRVGAVASAVFRVTGVPARNHRGMIETLVRLKAAAEADATLDAHQS